MNDGVKNTILLKFNILAAALCFLLIYDRDIEEIPLLKCYGMFKMISAASEISRRVCNSAPKAYFSSLMDEIILLTMPYSIASSADIQ